MVPLARAIKDLLRTQLCAKKGKKKKNANELQTCSENIRNRLAEQSSSGDLSDPSELHNGPNLLQNPFAEKQSAKYAFISASGISSNKNENSENAATKTKTHTASIFKYKERSTLFQEHFMS